MNNSKIKQYFMEFFSNKFILKFLMWLIGIVIFWFGLNFVVRSGVGQDVYDAFFTSIRIALGVNISGYGIIILLPGGSVLIIAALVLNYLRTKKIRIDYILGVVPLVFSGYLIDLIGKLSFFENMLNHTLAAKFVYSKYPLNILWIFIGIPLLYLGIGIFSGTRFMPSPYAIFVLELSIRINKKFSVAQIIVDSCLLFLGIVIMVICASTERVAGSVATSWYDIIKIISLGTLVSVATQGLIVGKTLMMVEKIFGYQKHA